MPRMSLARLSFLKSRSYDTKRYCFGSLNPESICRLQTVKGATSVPISSNMIVQMWFLSSMPSTQSMDRMRVGHVSLQFEHHGPPVAQFHGGAR